MRYRIDLKKEREKRGLTQAQLANLIGVTEKSISKWESGRGQPSCDNMHKICKEYNLDINKIDSVAISKRRIDMILNNCLFFVNVIIVFTILVQFTIGQKLKLFDINSNAAEYVMFSVTNRAKLWLMWFAIIPVINMFLPFVLRKNIAISSCASILIILLSMFVFKDVYSVLTNCIMFISVLAILIILFINNRKSNLRESYYDKF